MHRVTGFAEPTKAARGQVTVRRECLKNPTFGGTVKAQLIWAIFNDRLKRLGRRVQDALGRENRAWIYFLSPATVSGFWLTGYSGPSFSRFNGLWAIDHHPLHFPISRNLAMLLLRGLKGALAQGAFALAALFCCSAVLAQEAAIRKALVERLPKLPKIDEITRTPVAGLWEVRYDGTKIMYSDEKGDYIFFNGSMMETKTQTDLTEARVEKLLAIDFDKLPLKDAVVVKQGGGARKLAVFADPNCGYCKRLERDLAQLKDVTVYNFLVPILGPDSTAKSKDIWCAKDAVRAWRDWMLDNALPPKAADGCNSAAIRRNLVFARTHKIDGTPTIIFEDGSRSPRALPGAKIEKLLVAAAGKK
jgi:thiol:disulfide interchange protein DsbC